jgi:Protein of unknown function (DUF3995)
MAPRFWTVTIGYRTVTVAAGTREAAEKIAAGAGSLGASRRPVRRVAARTAAIGLLGVGALRLIWATGSSWPMGDNQQLTDAVVGTDNAEPPSAAACLAVAGPLTTATALVDGHPRSAPALSRMGSAGVVAVLATRGGLGLAGRTDLVSPGSTSEGFRRLDRRVYYPFCLALAALALPAVGDDAR